MTMFKAAILLLSVAAAAEAQDSSLYGFVAPGGVSSGGYNRTTLHTGVGGDVALVKGLGLNLEIGALGPTQDFSAAVGLFSAGATYHFRRGWERKLDPFVTSGYSLMFREGHANLWNLGGGTNYWFAKRIGARIEFRDHIGSACCEATHFWGFRFGVAFR
jgi:hypothetical protein